MGSVTLDQVLKSEKTGTITDLTDSAISSVGGNVGIGTMGPSVRLELSNIAADASALRFNLSSGNGTFDFADDVGAGGSNRFALRISSSNAATLALKNFGSGFFNIETWGRVIIKTGDGLSTDFSFNSGTNSYASITGNLGIGTVSPSAKLDVNGTFNVSGNATIPNIAGNVSVSGNVTATDCFATSDERLKEDIKPYRVPIAKLRELGKLLKSYKWRDSGNADIGLLAQDVEKQFPELVKTNEKGYKSVNYQKLNLMLLQWI